MKRPCKDCGKYFEKGNNLKNYCKECKQKRRGGGHLHKTKKMK